MLERLLEKRLKAGKEDPERLSEKKAEITKPHPGTPLIWLHAASVGEAQSSLILIHRLLESYPEISILVTTGTVTSAKVMEQKLPPRAFHQFYPLDHPEWVEEFLEYWSPDVVLWMESELWPNMLCAIKDRAIPAVLVNAKMSPKSYNMWRFAKPLVSKTLEPFDLILTQTNDDAQRYKNLTDQPVTVSGNLKYSADPLKVDDKAFKALKTQFTDKTTWVFASTHKGEEEMACRIHTILKNNIPNLLTIIVPRHPERRDQIMETCQDFDLNIMLRTDDKYAPEQETDVYIADTLGELGLFYRLCPVSCIGRSFSEDGGGGHNPLEAAQLSSAVIHGPNVQNLQEIYNDMNEAGAALRMAHESQMTGTLLDLLTDKTALKNLQDKGLKFTEQKAGIIDIVLSKITPLIEQTGIKNKDELQELEDFLNEDNDHDNDTQEAEEAKEALAPKLEEQKADSV